METFKPVAVCGARCIFDAVIIHSCCQTATDAEQKRSFHQDCWGGRSYPLEECLLMKEGLQGQLGQLRKAWSLQDRHQVLVWGHSLGAWLLLRRKLSEMSKKEPPSKQWAAVRTSLFEMKAPVQNQALSMNMEAPLSSLILCFGKIGQDCFSLISSSFERGFSQPMKRKQK